MSNDNKGFIEINRTRQGKEDVENRIIMTFSDDKKTTLVEVSLSLKAVLEALGGSGEESKETWEYEDNKTKP
jgi:hypothetical protein